MNLYWSVLPLHTRIIEIQQKKRGTLTDSELYQALSKSYGDLSFRELNKTLMKLELHGIIHVFRLTKNKRRVELKNVHALASIARA